jgi:F-type H+-transporting ATPase subunit c
MNRKVVWIVFSSLLVVLVTTQAFAADAESVKSQSSDRTFFFSVVAASCAFSMAIASGLCGLAQSRAIAQAMDGIARQPSAYKDIQTLLIIGLALIESLALYVLVVALILIYASPFTALVTGG